MSAMAVHLTERGVIALSGADALPFLQGLVTNDITKATRSRAVYAALLTPQGKYLFDFFIVREGDALLLDVEGARLADLIRRLMLYRLRAEVDIADRSAELAVWAVFGPGLETAPVAAAGLAYADPRHRDLGVRLILPSGATPPFHAAPADAYDRHRLAIGVPDGSRDIDVERTLILEANFEPLHGVDFAKGCYVGQELTARMKHRGKVRKRLIPVDLSGPTPARDTPVLADGREVGQLKSSCGGRALASLRLDDLGAGPFTCGASTITPRIPDWLASHL